MSISVPITLDDSTAIHLEMTVFVTVSLTGCDGILFIDGINIVYGSYYRRVYTGC